MAAINYDDAAAGRLEALYQGHDIAAQRADTLSRLALRAGETVLDIGSGPGFLCELMGEAVGPQGRVHGIDISADLLRRTAARNRLPWVSFAAGDAMRLSEPDCSFDAFTCIQVAEYLSDVDAFAAEAFRILRPGGRGVILATDWDGVVWHSDNPRRMHRVLDAFGAHCADPHLPCTLAPRLRAAGFQVMAVGGFPIVNIAGRPGDYSHGLMRLVADYLRAEERLHHTEIDGWVEELDHLAEDGRYFFMSMRIAFDVRRPV